MSWELVNNTEQCSTYRMKVPNGWLYKEVNVKPSFVAICFVPEPDRE